MEETKVEVKKEEDEFEKELKWAIEQLELGMKRNGTTQQQKNESMAVIKKLQSSKPKVEKIVLMRRVFGDYKKWMKTTEEEKQKEENERLKKQKKKENQKKKKEATKEEKVEVNIDKKD